MTVNCPKRSPAAIFFRFATCSTPFTNKGVSHRSAYPFCLITHPSFYRTRLLNHTTFNAQSKQGNGGCDDAAQVKGRSTMIPRFRHDGFWCVRIGDDNIPMILIVDADRIARADPRFPNGVSDGLPVLFLRQICPGLGPLIIRVQFDGVADLFAVRIKLNLNARRSDLVLIVTVIPVFPPWPGFYRKVSVLIMI